jgi:hypothetical protein
MYSFKHIFYMFLCIFIAVNMIVLPKEGQANTQDWIPCLSPSNGWYYRCNPHLHLATQVLFHISFNTANVALNHVTYIFQGTNYKFYPAGPSSHYNFRMEDIPNQVLSVLNRAWQDYITP